MAKIVKTVDAAAREEAGFWAQWSHAQGIWNDDIVEDAISFTAKLHSQHDKHHSS